MPETILNLTPKQTEVFSCPERFRTLVAGRRSGKTFLACSESLTVLVDPLYEVPGVGRKFSAWRPHDRPRRAIYVAPTYRQAKDVAWLEAKEMSRPFWAREPLETELKIILQGGHTLQLYGAENYDRIRGTGNDFAVIDEYADIHPDAWQLVIRHTLADRGGAALFIGTPKSFDHFHDLHQKAKELANWAAFSYTTEQGGLVSPEEVESARLEMDPLSFRQELLASFEDLLAFRAYYAFSDNNVMQADFDPTLPLILCCDFNISPMSWVLCQRFGDGAGGDIVQVLDEVVVRETSTPAQCRLMDEIVDQLLPPSMIRVPIQVYGDASGDSRSASGSPSDVRIIKEHFGNSPLYDASFHFQRSNPLQKDRVAAVNRMLGDIEKASFRQRLFVDPRCRELIKDLRQVVWQSDSHGNSTGSLSKKDADRTHASDALGYYIYGEFGYRGKRGWLAPRR